MYQDGGANQPKGKQEWTDHRSTLGLAVCDKRLHPSLGSKPKIVVKWGLCQKGNAKLNGPASGRQPDWHDTMLQGPEPLPNQQAGQPALGEQGEEPHRQPGREAVRP